MNPLTFVKSRCKGVGYALKGSITLLKTEESIQAQLIIGIVVTAVGFYFNITPTEWMVQTLCIGLIMGLEGMNTAVEALADYQQPNHDPKIGTLKDVAAGAVFFVAICSVIIGGIIYIPYLKTALS